MRTFLAGAVVVAAFSAANLVAAGVMAVLGPQAIALEGAAQLPAVIAVGGLALACALIFLKGCQKTLTDRLQYPAGRRGG